VDTPGRFGCLEDDGWALVSGERWHREHPDSFAIPGQEEREGLLPGDAAKLLFDVETRDGTRVVDRGVDRMWVIVKRRLGGTYLGVLDSDPGTVAGLPRPLRSGMELLFGPEHVIDIGHPPRSYITKTYGHDFFND
jgi:hypothetical protein